MASVGMWSRVARSLAVNRKHSSKILFLNQTRLPMKCSFSFLSNEKKDATVDDSGANPAVPQADKAMEEFQKQIEELTAKTAQLDDKYKRALAETENVRVRMKRQIDEAKLFGIQNFCKDLLEVADILAKATESVPPSELNNQNQHLKSLYDGLRMTEMQLQKVFTNHGLKQINPLGEKFDPNMHEALFEQAFEGKVAGTVAVVSKIGYSLNNRTIRPASVGVVKAS